MKIYVLADMEGISGIHLQNQVQKAFPADYAYGQRMLIEEINFVVDTLYCLGATEVVVRDAHTGGNNIQMGEMDGRATYEPACLSSLSLMDESFDGFIIIGQHSKAGTLNGFLDHTMNSMEWFCYQINGKEVGEIGILAARAGEMNVPLLAVTGDEKAVEEAKELLGEENVSGAVVKHGFGRNWAYCLPLEDARAEIANALGEALQRVGHSKPYKPALPATVELTLYRSDYADRYNGRSNFERVDARTVRKVVHSFSDSMW